ncbi:MAG: LptF/LptG family permease [Muribaculaceae bacterium]|nr:LptF/LptG family permease [Muribaculaceae bacterium]
MMIIKRLYTYMLQRFLPLLLMTFFICLFIVLMQFLWKSIDELVGKGLEMKVIGELFMYAALTMVPTALPLAVLLASLMVFGNLGEKFELTAMKASGISLFRIMRPLIVLMLLIAIGAFFFQNNVLPVAQTKMWTLFFSIKQKSPEVEIPEKAFYDQIPNMNLYVDKKNAETGMLYGMIIYDLSRGIDNTRVILADSGQFNFTQDKSRLFLHLYSGEMFENMRDNSLGSSSQRYLPFRREHFMEKEVYFPFDANFNRMDEAGMRSQYIGQNITQLRHSIDSIGHQVDSIGNLYADELVHATYFGIRPRVDHVENGKPVYVERKEVALDSPLDIDSVFRSPNEVSAKSYITQALAKSKRQKQDFLYRSMILAEQAKLMRRHDIEMQRKFTLSFACIIFFFIGAPLGAIIKKGGIGTPLVISVLLFIVYFIFDNAGFKLARDGKLPVWEGIWLSSAVLLPLGVFLTYKAVGDSAVFNIDAYRNFFRRLIGRGAGRTLSLKEVRMTDVDTSEALSMLTEFITTAEADIRRINAKPALLRLVATPAPQLKTSLNQLIDYLSNSTDIYTINLLNQYPFNPTRRNLQSVVANTKALIERVGGKPIANTINSQSDEPDTP